MAEDAELVARILEGDLKSFEALYLTYTRPVYHTALAISGDSGAAEEILQDTFVRAHRAMSRVDASVSLAPWLHRIAVNLSYNWTHRHRHWALDIDAWVERLIAGPAASPERAAEGTELQEVVREALATLGFKHRTVLVLFYLQGFNLAEIAYIMDCPVGTVKSRLHYACKSLRKQLRADDRLAGEVAYGTP
jgi:RNA polymerase sigma-70 factor (ECF subfamily)